MRLNPDAVNSASGSKELVIKVPAVYWSTVPSGSDFQTKLEAAICGVWLETTIRGLPGMNLPRLAARNRACVSVPPPGLNPTTSLIVLPRKCASASNDGGGVGVGASVGVGVGGTGVGVGAPGTGVAVGAAGAMAVGVGAAGAPDSGVGVGGG